MISELITTPPYSYVTWTYSVMAILWIRLRNKEVGNQGGFNNEQ